MHEKKCNHNLNDINSSLKQLPLLLLSFPPRLSFQCEECGEVFEYIKLDNGTYQSVKEVKEDASIPGNN